MTAHFNEKNGTKTLLCDFTANISKADKYNTFVIFSIEPAEELVQVNELVYGFLVPTFNDTFRTTVSWQKPKFTHSDVNYYKYKVLPIDSSQRERRGIALNTEITTVRIMTLNLLLTNY